CSKTSAVFGSWTIASAAEPLQPRSSAAYESSKLRTLNEDGAALATSMVAPKQCPSQSFIVECRVMDLTGLLGRSEGKTLEYKGDLSSPEGGSAQDIRRVCKHRGGTLL